jgi:hypothetical protein
MKFVLSIALGLLGIVGTGVPFGSTEDEIKKAEMDMAQLMLDVKRPVTVIDQYESDDVILTDPTGKMYTKEEGRKNAVAGQYKAQSD